MIVAVIGGGASGMAAALSASENTGSRVMLFERRERVGKKLLAAGNGRCNITNMNMSAEHFHGNAPDFCGPALSYFGVGRTLEFFCSLGLVTVTEPSGRVYPLSDHASSVVDTLRLSLEKDNVEVHTAAEVTDIKKTKNGFMLFAENTSYYADKVIVCAGGAASPKLGGGMSGYELLSRLGHTRTKLYPSLVQIRTDNTYTRALRGVRADAGVRLMAGGRVTAESAGEVQFADYGVSGPAVFDVSRAASVAKNAVLSLDFLRSYDKTEIMDLLFRKKEIFCARPLSELFVGILHNALGRAVLRYCGYGFDGVIRSLSFSDIEKITDGVKNFTLPVAGALGMESAQVTAGGVKTDEFDPKTLESRIVPGLFAAGEVLDIDGDCGGYNLQWAWSSGLLAGKTGGLV